MISILRLSRLRHIYLSGWTRRVSGRPATPVVSVPQQLHQIIVGMSHILQEPRTAAEGSPDSL